MSRLISVLGSNFTISRINGILYANAQMPNAAKERPEKKKLFLIMRFRRFGLHALIFRCPNCAKNGTAKTKHINSAFVWERARAAMAHTPVSMVSPMLRMLHLSRCMIKMNAPKTAGTSALASMLGDNGPLMKNSQGKAVNAGATMEPAATERLSLGKSALRKAKTDKGNTVPAITALKAFAVEERSPCWTENTKVAISAHPEG